MPCTQNPAQILCKPIKASRTSGLRLSASVRPSVRRPTYPLCELGVHHEVVDVFFGPRELQLSRDHGNEERRTAGALKREGKRR